jgi:hypothetical protein
MLKNMTKTGFHRKYSKVLKEVAQELGLQEYEVRSCKGGPAVYGEVILHAPTLYVAVYGDAAVYQEESRQHVLYRSCVGMKDYVGGRNRWCNINVLDQHRPTILESFREAMAASGKEARY